MNEDEVVQIVRSYIEGLFPRECPQCGLRFGSLREYLQLTTHVGNPISYDANCQGIPGLRRNLWVKKTDRKGITGRGAPWKLPQRRKKQNAALLFPPHAWKSTEHFSHSSHRAG